MSKRAQKSTNSVTLFPFLAVLVCAMGALILLLLVTTKRVREQALARQQAAEAPVEEPAPPEPEPADLPSQSPEPEGPELAGPSIPEPLPPPDYSELEQKVAALRDSRDALRNDVDGAQARVAAAQADVARAEARLRELQRGVRTVDAATVARSRTAAAVVNERTALDADIAYARKKITDLRQQHEQAKSEFAFVPFDPLSGTTRRPIYIECTVDGLRILPEDVFLADRDLDGFTDRFNPLLVGATALTQYWLGQLAEQPDKPDATPPYVLLLVRPNGSVAYYAARRYLAHLGQPFGYELIDDAYPLHMPPPDPQAKLVLERAVRETVASRDQVLASLAARGGLRGKVIEFDPLEGKAVERETAGAGPRNPLRMPASPDGPLVADGPPGSRPHGATLSNVVTADQVVDGEKGSPAGPGPESVSREQPPGQRPGWNGNTKPGGTARRGSPEQAPPAEIGLGQDETTAEQGEREHAAQQGGAPERLPPAMDSSEERTVPQAAGGTRESFPRSPRAPNSQNQLADSGDSAPPPPAQGPQVLAGTSDYSQRPSAKQQQRAQHRWGGGGMGAIGVEKTIEVQLTEGNMIVAREIYIPLDHGESRGEVVEQLLKALDEASRDWGPPPQGFFWLPAVEFRVFPGGSQHYERLQTPLREWGVFSKVKFEVGKKPPKKKS